MQKKGLSVFVLAALLLSGIAFTPSSALATGEEIENVLENPAQEGEEPAEPADMSAEADPSLQSDDPLADIDAENIDGDAATVSDDEVLSQNEAEQSSPEAEPLMLAPRDAGTHVARVGDTTFATLQAAIDSIASSGVVTVINDIWQEESVRIPPGKSIQLTDDGTARTVTKSGFDNTNPLFVIESGAELTLAASSDENLVIEQDQMVGALVPFVNKGNLFHNQGMLNLYSGTLHPGGFDEQARFSGAVYVDRNSVFNMSGGIIEKMNAYDSWYTSPVFVQSGGVFNLSGGQIRNNKNTYNDSLSGGGAVLLFVWSDNGPIAQMNMTGGSITGNSAKNGGGVYMTGRTDFNFSGGEISDNIAFNGDGGGVCVAAVSAIPHPESTTFKMTGGSIRGNSAKNGGGIYVNSDGVSLQAGVIENNTALPTNSSSWSGHGGGVYISEVPRVLAISNTIVTQNTATASAGTSGMGGGLWACPTGSITLKVTNGIAVFGNTAAGENTAGDDIVKVEFAGAPVQGVMTLPNRMLGGGRVQWYRDGEIVSGIVGSAAPGSARYNENAAGEPLTIQNSSENVAVKAIASPEAIRRAYEEATLFIQNNTAAHGGGIGTNGDITMPNYNVPDWTLKVHKVWDPAVDESRREEVEIFLMINDTVLDSLLLNAGNHWSAEFTELPSPDTLSGQRISVIEGERIPRADGTAVIQETSKWDVKYEDIATGEPYTLAIRAINHELPELPMMKIPVTKVWEDSDNQEGRRPSSILVRLFADGLDTGKTITLTETAGWTGEFANLDQYRNGQEIRYTIEEEAVDGYTATISGDQSQGYVLTNSRTPNPPPPPPPPVLEIPRLTLPSSPTPATSGPAQPTRPTEPTQSKAIAKEFPLLPQTGETHHIVWVGLLAVLTIPLLYLRKRLK